jgi:hypothetical protein
MPKKIGYGIADAFEILGGEISHAPHFFPATA